MAGRRGNLDEGPSAEDLERFGGETIRCRRCGTEVYDEAEWCHRCGEVLGEDARRLPRWAWVAGIVALAAFLLAFGLRLI
jgi:ribosomal protein L37E